MKGEIAANAPKQIEGNGDGGRADSRGRPPAEQQAGDGA